MSIPRIFISYSHDSDAHRAFVLALAHRLRADGLDCQLDQYVNGFPAQGWQRWMETQVEAADFVLLVCTPDYLQRFRGLERDGGRGVTFEGLVISQSLYDHYYRNTKFVAVLPEAGHVDDVPLPLKGFGVFRLMAEYEGVYRYLTGQPEVVVPELGDLKPLGPASIVRGEAKHPHPNPSPSQGEGLKSTSTDSPLPSGRGGQGVRGNTVSEQTHGAGKGAEPGRAGMSDTMKAALVGGVFVLVGAIIAGLFAWSAMPSNTTHGDNSPVITGNGNHVKGSDSTGDVSK